VAQRARQVRKAGYILFGGVALWLSVALVRSVLGGLDAGTIQDPFTGQPYAEHQADCTRWAQSIQLSAPPTDSDPRLLQWRLEAESWITRCGHLLPTEADTLRARTSPSLSPR
jgi:hypothetical protein